MKKITIIFTLILTAFAANSDAQFTGGVGSTWNNPVSAQLNRMAWDNITQRTALVAQLKRMGCTETQIKQIGGGVNGLQNALAKKSCTGGGETQNTQAGGNAKSSASTRTSTTQPASVHSTTFSPTGTRIAMPGLVAKITPNDKALQQRQIALLEAAISTYETQQRSRGYANDVAAAMAFFAAVSIQLQNPSERVSNKAIDTLTDALRATFGNKLADISDRDKQQLYESLLTIGMFIAANAENADAKTLATLKNDSATLCEQYLKLDVTKYRFSESGLVAIQTGNNAQAPSGRAATPPSGGRIDPKLIGSWQASSAEVYVFHSDGRFNHFSTQSQVEGRFSVSNGKIHLSNIVYEKGTTWEKRYPDAVYEYELGKDDQGNYLKIANFLYGVAYVDISTGYKFRK